MRQMTAVLVVAALFLLGSADVNAQPQNTSESPRTFAISVLAHRVSWSTVPGAWSTASVLPLLRDNPAAGYFSANPTILETINAQMTANGIESMVSWWGPDTYGGDPFMDTYLSMPGPPLAVLYEATGRLKNNNELYGTPVGKGGERISFSYQPNADTFVADLVYLHRKYFTGLHADRFVRVDGRPVVFIWISHAFDGPFDKAMERVREQVPVYMVGSDFSVPIYTRPGIEHIVPAMDALSAYGFYDPAVFGIEVSDRFISENRRALSEWSSWMDVHAPHMHILAPLGFNYDETLIPGRTGLVFHSSPEIARRWAQAIRTEIANPCKTRLLPMVYVTSYDECYEGTCIIPSEEYGSSYLDVVSGVFGPPVVITAEDIAQCHEDHGR